MSWHWLRDRREEEAEREREDAASLAFWKRQRAAAVEMARITRASLDAAVRLCEVQRLSRWRFVRHMSARHRRSNWRLP